MLAQLQKSSGVDAAAVDRRGELIRIRLRPGASIDVIRTELELMGFASETVDGPAVAERWYGPSDVRELSREEAVAVATRVTRTFGAAHDLTADRVTLATSQAAAALYGWFVDRSNGMSSGPELASCGRAVGAATGALLGADRARALGDAIEADLAGASHG